MRILITRPQPQAAATREKLVRNGHYTDVAPMMEIRFLPLRDFQGGRWQGLIFTSANGVKAAEKLTIDRGLPAYCVGDATADAAKSAGFSDVRIAGGNADRLYELIRNRPPPAGATLVHFAGRHIAGNLAERLAADGYRVERVTAYEAERVAAFPSTIADRIKQGEYDAVLFYSPRTAKIFAELAEAEGLSAHMAGVFAVCLSEAVKKEASRLSWRRIVLAKLPTERHLLQAMKKLTPAL